MIDDFKVYGRALNENEINQLAAKAIQREQEEAVKKRIVLILTLNSIQITVLQRVAITLPFQFRPLQRTNMK